MAKHTIVETLLLQAAGLLDLTENTIQGCRIMAEAQPNREVKQDLFRVLSHVLEARRMLRYLILAERQAQEARSDNGHDPWEDDEENEGEES